MAGKFQVSSSPHIRAKVTTSKIMLSVIIALLPAALFGVWLNGPYAALILILSIAAAVLTEYCYEKVTKGKITISDGSAALTGLLLGMNMPPRIAWWMPVLGSVFAILVVKQFFGGLGQNFMNPALAGRCFLMLSFAGSMTNFDVAGSAANKIVDTVSGATPLAAIKAGETGNLLSMFLGTTKGTIGETSALLLLIGGIFLICTKVISPRIPLVYLGTFAVFALIFGGRGFDLYYIACELCGGGIMLGAFFMATDYVTRPITVKGQYVYAVILGVMTGIFRIFGGSAEGTSYAIIFTNLLVPLIERATIPAGFGVVREKKKGGDAA
ncbi:MAG: RnfABCDGE type electron transport complex subunit D [Eubacterium sp.]|nr:RnfABCDGE type electron transport complex subunit D [Eubacterium sp.]